MHDAACPPNWAQATARRALDLLRLTANLYGKQGLVVDRARERAVHGLLPSHSRVLVDQSLPRGGPSSRRLMDGVLQDGHG
jgi:hypothetical protein